MISELVSTVTNSVANCFVSQWVIQLLSCSCSWPVVAEVATTNATGMAVLVWKDR